MAKSKLKKLVKKSSKGKCKNIAKKINYFKVSYFTFSDKNLKDFIRFKGHGVDCVINAMELIKIVTPQAAGIMRIIVEPQNGIPIPVIQNIFSFIYPGYVWKFKEYNKFEDFINDIIKNFPIDTVVFCGMEFHTGERHVYLIGKDSSSFWIIDAHSGFCNLSEQYCIDYLKNAKSWHILEYM